MTNEESGRLTIAFSPDPGDEGFGRVHVSAQADGFAGVGRCWEYPAALIGFAAGLRHYPLDPAEPPIFQGGHGGSGDGRVPPLETVRIEARPEGLFGQVALVASLKSDEEPPIAGYRQGVQLVLLTTYERLRRFADEVDEVAAGRSPDASIVAERLA